MSARTVLGGVRLDPGADQPQLWFVAEVHDGEDARTVFPITRDDRLVLFADPTRAKKVAQSEDEGMLLVDVAHTMHCIESGNVDPEGLVFESIILLLDLLRAVDQEIPTATLASLLAAAEAIGDDADRCRAFADDADASGAAADAVLWCVGAIAVLTSVA